MDVRAHVMYASYMCAVVFEPHCRFFHATVPLCTFSFDWCECMREKGWILTCVSFCAVLGCACVYVHDLSCCLIFPFPTGVLQSGEQADHPIVCPLYHTLTNHPLKVMMFCLLRIYI